MGRGRTQTELLIPAGMSFSGSEIVINPGGNDVDFRIASDTNSTHFVSDAGSFSGYGSIYVGNQPGAGTYFYIGPGAMTSDSTASAPHAIFRVTPHATLTLAANKSTVATAYFDEPNITLNGKTVTDATTVVIANAPTEGSTNSALWVASGATILQDLKLSTVGTGLYMKTGTNATYAVLTLSSGGTALFYSSKHTATTSTFVSSRVRAGTVGFLSVGTLSSGAVQIVSSSTTDTSQVTCMIIEQA